MENRYEIRGKVGQGGIGSVHRGWDRKMEREVAIKRILTSQDDPTLEEEATKQMMAEAEALASLQHPHIVTIYDIGHDETGPYVVMELINGQSLDEVIENGPMTWHDFKKVAIETLEALIAAQELGMIHSDLKPPNIMLSWLPSGTFQAKIVDFGLAVLIQNQSKEEIENMDSVFGSIFFMPPEQFERETLDARSDLYSIGCVYYQCLTGVYPFNGESGNEVMEAHLNHTVTPIQELRDDIPAWAAEWVMWLINRDREDRPQSASEAQSTFLEREKEANQSTSRRRLIVGNKTSPVTVATARQQVQGVVTSSVRTATPGILTTTSAHPELEVPEQAPEKPWWVHHQRRLIIAAAAVLLLTAFAWMLIKRNQRVMLTNNYVSILEMVEKDKPSEVPMDGELLQFFLDRISNAPENADLSKPLKALQLAKATDDTNMAIAIARFATSAQMPDEIRKQVIDEVVYQRQELEVVPIMLAYAKKAQNAQLATAACDAIHDMVGPDEAEALLELLATSENDMFRETVAYSIERIIKDSGRSKKLVPMIRKAQQNASNGSSREVIADLLKLAEGRPQSSSGGSTTSTSKPPSPKPPSPKPPTPKTSSPELVKLREAVEKGDSAQKLAAIKAVGKSPDYDAHGLLMGLCEDSANEPLRTEIIKAFIRINSHPEILADKDVRGRWLQTIWRTKNAEQKKLVIDGLEAIGTDWAVEHLQQISRDAAVSAMAREAIERIKGG